MSAMGKLYVSRIITRAMLHRHSQNRFPGKYAKMLTSNRILVQIREQTEVKASTRGSPSGYMFKVEAALSIASFEYVTFKDIALFS